ncbi:hypothetical protein [Pseudokineococcus sp. 1T1Z-3]|uniref:hypothetical protein n=1 Tax=Pseudokineococcus sp. 1T1Z-3 TaxID=3132745 RepID=UPI0030A21D91
MVSLMMVLGIGTAVWLGLDATRLQVRPGVLGSRLADLGVAGWVVCCLLLWVVTLPVYLVMRPRYVRLHLVHELMEGVPAGPWPEQA